MKRTFLLLVVLLFTATTFAQSVGINSDGSLPDASAMLDVKSSTKGFLAPRMASLPATGSLPDGLIVYKNDGLEADMGYYYCKNNTWIKIGDATDATQWTTSGSDIYYNSGNVGIGTTTPNEKLEVNGNIGLPTTGHISKVFGEGTEEFIIKGNNTSGFDPFISYTRSTVSGNRGFKFGIWDNNGNRNDWFTIWNGYVGIGTTTPSKMLYVNGSAGGTEAWNSSSDARLKKDVVNINNGLDKVMQLRPVTFNWKQEDYPDMNLDDRNHVGFIAQEVELVVPQVVSTAGDEMQTKSIAYSDLVPVLTKAIQEQQAEIEALKALNANLKAENSSIKSDVEALKNVVFGTAQLKQQ